MKYWACEPVWGFGMAAASYINGERTVRPSNMQRYSEFVHDLESGSMLDICTKAKFRPHMTENPDIFEFLMLTLRTKCGLDLLEFEKLYGSKLKNGKIQFHLSRFISDIPVICILYLIYV